MNREARTYVAGADTLIGGAIVGELRRQGYRDLVGLGGDTPDLQDRREVEAFFEATRPELVFVASGRSGGIAANQAMPAELMQDNLLGAAHVVHAAHLHGARKLLYLASSCCYPRLCPQPMREEHLHSGPLEPTNHAYAMAKLSGLSLTLAYRQQYGDDFICGIPANCFGPGDDFSPENSHVIAALLRRMHEAKLAGDEQVSIWGSGAPLREFIYSDDLASACIFVMEHYSDARPINLGGGTELSIAHLAELAREVVGYRGRLVFDASRPDGMPRKALDSSRLLEMGWRPRHDFYRAVEVTFRWFLEEDYAGGSEPQAAA